MVKIIVHAVIVDFAVLFLQEVVLCTIKMQFVSIFFCSCPQWML